MVLFPLSSRRRLKRSTLSGECVSCESSTCALAVLRYRIKRRARFIKEQQADLRVLGRDGAHERPCTTTKANQGMQCRRILVNLHSKSLQLSSTQGRDPGRLHSPSAPNSAVVHIPPEEGLRSLRQPRVVVAHRPVEIRVETFRQLLDKRLRATQPGGEADLLVVASS